jgi:aryl-alcohol dehydrogenase-like predicted oxidoreductase
VLHRIASKRGATPHQIALAFLTRLPGTFTIPKASTIAHVEENAAAGDVTLDAGEIAALDMAFPAGNEGPLATL